MVVGGKTPRVAADTNAILTPTPRRFVTAVLEREGGLVAVTPTVRRKMAWHLIENARARIARLQRRDPAPDVRIAEAARAAAGKAAAAWWNAQAAANDGAFVFVDPENRRQRDYEDEFARFPDSAFADSSDRQIAAEAVVHGLPLLATCNFNTTDPAVLADSAENGVCGNVAVVSIRELVRHFRERRGAGTDARYALETVCGACVSVRERPVEDDVDSAQAFIDNLAKGERSRKLTSAGRVSMIAQEELDSLTDDELRRLVADARHNRPVVSRTVEGEYHRMVCEAVRNVGYDPWSSR